MQKLKTRWEWVEETVDLNGDIQQIDYRDNLFDLGCPVAHETEIDTLYTDYAIVKLWENNEKGIVDRQYVYIDPKTGDFEEGLKIPVCKKQEFTRWKRQNLFEFKCWQRWRIRKGKMLKI